MGPHAELTWFVPGGGFLAQPKDSERDAPPDVLAVQDGPASSTTNVVFSVSDGKVIKPALPRGGRLGSAFVYPGGFGYEYDPSGGYSWDRVAFFDDSGRVLSQPDVNGTIMNGSRDIPIVRTPSADVVLTLDGRRLVELSKAIRMRYTRLIGERLFVTMGTDGRSWQQYDLRDGSQGKTCDIEGFDYSYIASDRDVALLKGEGSAARAFDLATCEELWRLPGETQSEGKDVWRVNTTLIQRINDELFSLVAPA